MDLRDFVDQHDPRWIADQEAVEDIRKRARDTMILAGDEAERFLNSPLGAVLVNDAATELQAARKQMEEMVNKLDDEQIPQEYKRLMFRIEVIKTAINWLLTAVVTGNNSLPTSSYYEDNLT